MLLKNLTFVLIVFSFCAKSQNVYKHLEISLQAEKLFKDGEFYKSGKKYDEAFDLLSGHWGNYEHYIEYLMAARAWASANENTKAISYLKRSVEKGYNNFEKIDTSTYFSDLKLEFKEDWDTIKMIINERNLKYGEVRKILEKSYQKDQALRRSLGCLIDNFGVKSEEVTTVKEIISELDSLNQLLAKKIINNYQWLDVSKVGKKANSALWAIIQHGDLELQKQVLPYIKKSVQNGLTQGSKYALMFDKIECLEGRKQIFGSQIKTLDEGTQTLFPIKDIENVNRRRAKYGLQPIEEYLQVFFDIDYKEYLKNLSTNQK